MSSVKGNNVIIITTDQQRFDTLGCNGNPFIKTPNLDALAAEGARFERAYCSNPVCTPSRVSLMTGLLPSRHGSYNIGTVAADTKEFLSTILTEKGYRTHQLGKAHFYPWDQPSPETREPDGLTPFYEFAGFETAELSVGHSDWGVNGHYEKWLNARGIKKGQKMPQLQVKRITEQDAYQCGDWGMPEDCHSGAWILDRTKDFLETRDQTRPFYLNIGFQDPHHPLALPEESPRIPEEWIPLPDTGFDPRVKQLQSLAEGRIEEEYGGKYGIAGNQDTAWGKTSTEQIRKVRSYYYSMVELFDRQIGTLIRLLKENDAWENTLLIVTSDHGDLLFDHGLGEKGPVAYEEVLKVPLLMIFPGKIQPQTVSRPVSLLDIRPTIEDFLFGTVPQCDGISLKPYLQTQQKSSAEGKRADTLIRNLPRKGIAAEFKEEADAIRYRCFITERWKLVEYPGQKFGELYDLVKDPKEEQNRWFEPEALPIKYNLLREMLQERESHDFMAERPCRC